MYVRLSYIQVFTFHTSFILLCMSLYSAIHICLFLFPDCSVSICSKAAGTGQVLSATGQPWITSCAENVPVPRVSQSSFCDVESIFFVVCVWISSPVPSLVFLTLDSTGLSSYFTLSSSLTLSHSFYPPSSLSLHIYTSVTVCVL